MVFLPPRNKEKVIKVLKDAGAKTSMLKLFKRLAEKEEKLSGGKFVKKAENAFYGVNIMS